MWHHLVKVSCNKCGDRLYQDGKEVSKFEIKGVIVDFVGDILWLKVVE